ncbi:MAG: hypothetical protein KF746_10815 [Chitinophagaceae bacterium]|nr:hypothetical protein [Chitinophagaceae bacterium]
MFFVKLYHYRRSLFALAVAACLIQLVIFYKQGAVATPFFNYGMYSDRILPKPQYEIYKLYVNGVLLKGDDYSIQEWDKIYVPVYLFYSKDTVNESMVEFRNRLLSKMRLTTLQENNCFFENKYFNEAAFYNWYPKYLSTFSQHPVTNIRIIKQNYQWDGRQLQPAADSIVLFQQMQ